MPTVTLTTDVDTATGLARAHEVVFEFRATASREVDGIHVPPAPFAVVNEDTVDLPTLPAGYAWRIAVRVVTVRAELPINLPVRHVLPPDEDVNYLDLVDVDPKTLEPVGPAPVDAWRAAVQQVATAAAIEAATAALAVLAPDLLVSGRIAGRRLLLTDRAGDDVDAGTVVPTFAAGNVATGAPGAAASLALRGGPLEWFLDATLPKGDAGGLPFSVDLASANLNDVKSPGVYRQPQWTLATLARNYPFPSTAYVVEVLAVAGTTQLIQRATPQAVEPGGPAGFAGARGFWLRRFHSGTTWDAWRFVATQRIDSPAGNPGVGVYSWNDRDGREEQLVATNLLLGTGHLDDVLTAGVYRNADSTEATAARGYPAGGVTGVLEVVCIPSSPSHFNYLQRYTITGGTSANVRGFYQRRRAATTNLWEEWRFVSVQRIDKSAGLAVYTWDDVAGREQFIYGDTGWREVKALLINGWDATTCAMRRVGSTVSLNVINTVPGTATGLMILPAGFRCGLGGVGNHRAPYFRSAGAIGTATAGGDVLTPDLTAGSLSTSWVTHEPWPSALPGNPIGTVPNL